MELFGFLKMLKAFSRQDNWHAEIATIWAMNIINVEKRKKKNCSALQVLDTLSNLHNLKYKSVCISYFMNFVRDILRYIMRVMKSLFPSLVPRLLHSGTRNWIYAYGESLVFFLTWETSKVEER